MRLAEDIHVVTGYLHGEHYVFTFRPSQTDAVMNQLGLFAANSDLSFDWHDAAQMAIKIRSMNRRMQPATDRYCR